MKFCKSVIVLGAGASKGAKIVGPRTPPLDSEFLDAAAEYFVRRRARGKRGTQVAAWNNFKRKLVSAGVKFSDVRRWRLEQLSTFLEARSNLSGLQLHPGRPFQFQSALESLKVLVCHVLQTHGGTSSCELHKSLIDLVTPRAILSFNYDIIADQSLAELGKLNWRREQYRCAKVARIISQNGTTKYKTIHSGRLNGSIPLLKLHGSIHFEKLDRGSGYRLAGIQLPNNPKEKFEYDFVPDIPFIIPPIAAKIDIAQPALRDRWKVALDHLHAAPSWIFWGYSFPQTDTISQVLFRTALRNNRKPKPVVVINPDASVIQRVRNVCQKVSIIYFPSIERFLLEHKELVLEPR